MTRPRPVSEAVAAALGELAGAVVVLDRELRIAAASPEAEALLGQELPTGERAVKVLCGRGDVRPIADALSAGTPAIATVVRPRPAQGDVAMRVRAVPLRSGRGWLLGLSVDATEVIPSEGPVDFHGIITGDPSFKRVLHVAARAAASEVTVLVRGETGTGKELVARALHTLSPRAAGPFRAINCAALSPALLESELFGHVRGAFTGAVQDRAGLFRSASGGTLFLDEVGEMPPDLQAKLLRVIETRAVTPVGGVEPVAVDVRIVAATHRSLRAEVAAGRFRADLMYRLRKVPLFLPPLRERPGDVRLLADALLARLSARGPRVVEHIGADAHAVLARYDWPGNVRELSNALEYALVVGEGPVVTAAELPPEIVDPAGAPDARGPIPVNAPPEPGPLVDAAADRPSAERARIARALERAGGHRGRAAKSLGWSRVTLWRHMKSAGL